MAVRVREKTKGSGDWWIFINHHGKRKSKKIGKDKAIALEVAEKIKAKLVLNELSVEKIIQNVQPLKSMLRCGYPFHMNARNLHNRVIEDI